MSEANKYYVVLKEWRNEQHSRHLCKNILESACFGHENQVVVIFGLDDYLFESRAMHLSLALRSGPQGHGSKEFTSLW